MGLDRQRKPAIAARRDEWPATAKHTLSAAIAPRVVSTPLTRSAVAADAGHLAVLDDVDAARAGAARIAPGHRVMAHRAAATLQEAAEHGIAAIVQIDQRHQRLHRARLTALGVDAEQAHLVGAPREQVPLAVGVDEIERAALARPSR